MKVWELKELLEEADDQMEVLIPTSMVFDGVFISPCDGESGVADLGFYEDEDDEAEAALLNKPTTRKDFVLVPHGFFDENDGVDPELN